MHEKVAQEDGLAELSVEEGEAGFRRIWVLGEAFSQQFEVFIEVKKAGFEEREAKGLILS